MRVLVTFAVDAEFAPWRDLRKFRKVTVNAEHYSGGREVHEANIGSSLVWVKLTGIGIKSFDFEEACCFVDAGVEAVISSGLAGALKDHVSLEQIIVPKTVRTLKDVTGLATSRELAHLAERRGATPVKTLLTSDHIIATHEEKTRLAAFGDAVDMESFHVVSEFSAQKAPVGVVRAISDRFDQDLPVDFARVLTQEGRVKPGALFGELVRRPSSIPALVRFGQQSRNAARRLAMFLDGLVGALTPQVVNSQTTAVEAP
jgi:adenosylhomocysteine nucleosidase